ncbi:protease inhibitor I42 family protein [Glycomyces dulcitolivorans]|uniref:protease inhibitor I42 family protein n=1 Tax=Glycomyces dulcitolivorans TaxID=2200759 RepID=UPI000DD308F9|nr:protease inhibitor I42 family protein [Glycomyces dulcitolivorans]
MKSPIGRLRLAALLSVLALAVSACSGPDDGDTVALDAGTATVAAGEELWVDLGEVSASVGDNWFLVEGPDADVLVETGTVNERPLACDLGLTECGDRLLWGFDAVAAGETELVFQYCLQTGLEDCEAGTGLEAPEPVELTVVVVG